VVGGKGERGRSRGLVSLARVFAENSI